MYSQYNNNMLIKIKYNNNKKKKVEEGLFGKWKKMSGRGKESKRD
jgi:hypothetical protein